MTQGISNCIERNGDKTACQNIRKFSTLSSPNVSGPNGINAVDLISLSPTENTGKGRWFTANAEGLFFEINTEEFKNSNYFNAFFHILIKI